MKIRTRHMTRTLFVQGSMLFLLACQGADQADTEDLGPADVETAYFNLSKEAQTEVLGTQIKSMSEMRKELLTKADADGDGQLSEAEKAELRSAWKELKAQLKAALVEKLDADGDGEVSLEEKKAALQALGQKIKAILQEKLGEMRTARQAAKARIEEACANARDAGMQLNEPEAADSDEAINAEINTALEECKAVRAEEKEKLKALLKESLVALKAEIDELKGILSTVQSQSGSESAE